MEKFRLTDISSAEKKDLSQGTFIVLLNALNVPPHLLLSVNGSLYSITDSGRQVGSPLEKMIGFIRRKKIPTLFVEWKLPENQTSENLKSEIQKNVLSYLRVDEKVSCLFPIRDTAVSVLGDEMKKANFIFELLPLMKKANALGKTFAMNMENEIGEDGNFELLTYSEKDLSEAILSAKTS